MVWRTAFDAVTAFVNQKFRQARIFCDVGPADSRHGATNGDRLCVGTRWLGGWAVRLALHSNQRWTVRSTCRVHPDQAKRPGTAGSSQSQRFGVRSSRDSNPGRQGISWGSISEGWATSAGRISGRLQVYGSRLKGFLLRLLNAAVA